MLLITFLFYQSSSSGTCLARAGVIFWDWNWNLKRSSQLNRMRVQVHEFAQSLRLNIDSRVSYGSPLRPDEKCRSSGCTLVGLLAISFARVSFCKNGPHSQALPQLPVACRLLWVCPHQSANSLPRYRYLGGVQLTVRTITETHVVSLHELDIMTIE